MWDEQGFVSRPPGGDWPAQEAANRQMPLVLEVRRRRDQPDTSTPRESNKRHQPDRGQPWQEEAWGSSSHQKPAEPDTPTPKVANPFFQFINATPPNAIPARIFELCKQATVTRECVTGVAGCVLAWKSHCDSVLMIRAMSDAYVQRAVNAHSKLAIFYIFNDVVQRHHLVFAPIGMRHLLQVISPIVASLPPDQQSAHIRTLEVLRERQIYTKEEVARLRKAFSMNLARERQILKQRLASGTDDRLYQVTSPSVKGKIDSSIKAMKAFCQDPRAADSAMAWASSLMTAAGLAMNSTPEEIQRTDLESRRALSAAVSKALKFLSLELELVQFFLLDWAVSVSENRERLLVIAEALPKNASTKPSLTAAPVEPPPVLESDLLS